MYLRTEEKAARPGKNTPQAYGAKVENDELAVNIPFELLRKSGFNTFKIDDIDKLVAEIKTTAAITHMDGLIHGLGVIGPYEDGTYRIISGERRFCAIERIREKEPGRFKLVPCKILSTPDLPKPAQQLTLEIANESIREFDNTPHRLAIMRHLKELADSGEVQERKVARIMASQLGMSTKYARCYKSIIFNGNPEIQLLIEEDMLDIKTASSISYLPEDIQLDMIAKIRAGENPKKLYRSYRDSLKTNENDTGDTEQVYIQTEIPSEENDVHLHDEGLGEEIEPVEDSRGENTQRPQPNEPSSDLTGVINNKVAERKSDTAPVNREERTSGVVYDPNKYDSSRFTMEGLMGMYEDHTGTRPDTIASYSGSEKRTNIHRTDTEEFIEYRMDVTESLLNEILGMDFPDDDYQDIISLCIKIAEKFRELA